MVFRKILSFALAAVLFIPVLRAQDVADHQGGAGTREGYVEAGRFNARWATQGVAVDRKHCYVIDNTHITKFTKQGDSLTTWSCDDKSRFRHLNYGIVVGRKLYCAHSNFPLYPMTSSVEIFDTRTMRHIGSHSFGIDYGSLTWIIPSGKCWYTFFAHYTKPASQTKGDPDDHKFSQLVKFDSQWRKIAAWTLPESLLGELGTASLSGGILIGDTFYCTGHDCYEVHKLKIPESGSSLEWVGNVKVPFYGQAASLDRDGSLWGIIRKEHVVVHGVPANE